MALARTTTATTSPSLFKKGDKVLISKYGGTEVKIDGDECLILNEGDILGILG